MVFNESNGQLNYFDISDGGFEAWGSVTRPANLTIATESNLQFGDQVSAQNAEYAIAFDYTGKATPNCTQLVPIWVPPGRNPSPPCIP